MNILVLGHNGMLGHMVVKYLTDHGHQIQTTDYRFPSIDFKSYVIDYDGDFIVNCIGAIPQKTSDFNVNAELPIWLDVYSNTRILHAGTDCESDNTEYGISKKKASGWIKLSASKTKIIKTSIIGPEIKSKSSLLEWFLNSTSAVTGFSNAMWNGITTLEWSKNCENIINNWDSYSTETILYSDCISKFEVLETIKTIFLKEIDIMKDDRPAKNKCLKGDVYTGTIKTQLEELKKYYYGN